MSLSLEAKSEKILRSLSMHGKRAKKGAMKGFWYAGKDIQKTIQERIKDKSAKTGRFYLYKGRRHQASAPGEYPANRSGTLRKSIGFEVKTSESLIVGSRGNIKYPTFLELGTKKMSKRSYLDRTVKEKAIQVLNTVGREIEKEIIR